MALKDVFDLCYMNHKVSVEGNRRLWRYWAESPLNLGDTSYNSFFLNSVLEAQWCAKEGRKDNTYSSTYMIAPSIFKALHIAPIADGVGGAEAEGWAVRA